MAQETVEIVLKARDEFSQNMGKMNNSLGTFVASLSRFATTTAGVAIGAIAGIATGLQKLAMQAAELGDELADLSKATGLSVETLSALRVGAELADSSLADVAVGLHRMQIALGQASEEGKETRQ